MIVTVHGNHTGNNGCGSDPVQLNAQHLPFERKLPLVESYCYGSSYCPGPNLPMQSQL